MDDVTYLEANFIEKGELCSIANITPAQLEDLINAQAIPHASYEVATHTTITSPLGDKTEIHAVKQYFSKSVTGLLETNINKAPEAIKAEMKKEYIKAVLAFDTESLLCADESELDALFEARWDFYNKGVYGICTHNASPVEIAKKGIAVQKLIQFLEVAESLSEQEREARLTQLNDNFNEVATIFSPYQRATSSRGKYLDMPLQKYGLQHLIKEYE